MSVKLEWEIFEPDPGDLDEPPPPTQPPPRWWRRRGVMLAGLVILGITVSAAFVAWMYRAQLGQVSRPVDLTAQLEAQAVATGDQSLFMALQDPNDSLWHEVQEQRFGRLERLGLPEFGWQAMDVMPRPGKVRLEPGGARLDVTYYFSVTQPLPGGPLTVTLRVPQFYKPVSSGWVHAMPEPDFWGRLRTEQGEHIQVLYFQRDADLIEPLIPRLDDVVGQVCSSLACPSRVRVTFQKSAESLLCLSCLTYGLGDESLVLEFPSPHLFGIPADEPSRSELYRAVQTRLVWALMYDASGRRLVMDYPSSQVIIRWQLARLGLSGPFITPGLTRTLATLLQAGVWQPLETISLQSRLSDSYAAEANAATGVIMPLTLAFVEERFGPGSASRLVPALGMSLTLGEAISATFGVDAATLDVTWWKYLRQQAGMLVAHAFPPDGELTLECASTVTSTVYSVWSVRTDGSELEQLERDARFPIWSPDGKRYAYIHPEDQADDLVSGGSSLQSAPKKLVGVEIGWLPDGRLWGVGDTWVVGPDGVARKDKASLINPDLGEVIQITGTAHTWSPDGTRVAYLHTRNLGLWVADVDGQNAEQVAPGWWAAKIRVNTQDTQQIAPGYKMAWSPDSEQLAFIGHSTFYPPGPQARFLDNELRIVDIVKGSERILARSYDLGTSIHVRNAILTSFNDLVWSPDGSAIAVIMRWPGWLSVLILDTGTGEIHARLQASWADVSLPYHQPWSSDGRYLVFEIAPDPSPPSAQGYTVVIWDTQTDQCAALPGGGWAWSPDGTWLAVLQRPGVLFVKSDLSAMHWVDAPDCSYVTWRPDREDNESVTSQ